MERVGIPLMEVFKVIYLGHENVKPEEQHGTIKLITASSIQDLYNVPDQDPKSKIPVKYQDEIALTVDRPTFSFTDATLVFDLFSSAYEGTIEVKWSYFQLCYAPVFVEERRIQSRDGTGAIAVVMGQFNNATIATLEVKLLNHSAASDVYGVVVASSSALDVEDCTSMLLVKEIENKIKVGADGVIPLSKSRVGVPLDSVLYVDISLHVNGQHYRDTVYFDAEIEGEFEKTIAPFNAEITKGFVGFNSESDPMIRVKVNWDASRRSRLRNFAKVDDPME